MQVTKPRELNGTENERSAPSARDLAQVLEQSGEAAIVKDSNAVVTYWNREAASLYGFSSEEAIGQPLRTLHAAEVSEAEYASLLARVRAGRPTSSTAERRKKSGETVRVTLNTTPLLDEEGALIGEITIARDVTALFQKEEALRRAERELRLQVKDVFPRSAVPCPSNPTRPTQIRLRLDKGPFNEILVGLAVLVSSCISIALTQVPGGIALFWPGSAIAAAGCIRRNVRARSCPCRRWWRIPVRRRALRRFEPVSMCSPNEYVGVVALAARRDLAVALTPPALNLAAHR
jgi:PAS domain S-box-containing protein